MGPLETSCETASGASILSASGDIDSYCAPQLQTAIDGCLFPSDAPVIIDLSDVTFLDSTGLAVLTRTAQRLFAAERDLAIVVDDPQVHRVFTISGTDQMLTITSTRHDAHSHLTG